MAAVRSLGTVSAHDGVGGLGCLGKDVILMMDPLGTEPTEQGRMREG